MGRLTKDPETRTTAGDNPLTVARYTLAVDRIGAKDKADFISCVVFGKGAEFAEKYFHKGMRVAVTGRIQTGSYTNKDGNKVYTTDVVLNTQEFADRKEEQGKREEPEFMQLPEGIDEELPFA